MSRTLGLSMAVLGLMLAAATPSLAHEREQDAGDPSATDVRWAAMMEPHHRMGIELTELALEKSDNDGVRAVAEQSKDDQQSQLPELRAIIDAGSEKPMPPDPPIARFNEQQMETLRSLSGAEFDRMWLDVFSSHHMAAVMMTQAVQPGTAGGLAQDLQHEIVEGQLRQIDTMNDLREDVG